MTRRPICAGAATVGDAAVSVFETPAILRPAAFLVIFSSSGLWRVSQTTAATARRASATAATNAALRLGATAGSVHAGAGSAGGFSILAGIGVAFSPTGSAALGGI